MHNLSTIVWVKTTFNPVTYVQRDYPKPHGKVTLSTPIVEQFEYEKLTELKSIVCFQRRRQKKEVWRAYVYNEGSIRQVRQSECPQDRSRERGNSDARKPPRRCHLCRCTPYRSAAAPTPRLVATPFRLPVCMFDRFLQVKCVQNIPRCSLIYRSLDRGRRIRTRARTISDPFDANRWVAKLGVFCHIRVLKDRDSHSFDGANFINRTLY